MKLITATRLKQLGVDVWPVNGPIFYDRFSHPDLTEVARKLESKRFTSEEEAARFIASQPWPRFALDAPTNEETARAQAFYADLEPKNEFVVRFSIGPMDRPKPPQSSSYWDVEIDEDEE